MLLQAVGSVQDRGPRGRLVRQGQHCRALKVRGKILWQASSAGAKPWVLRQQIVQLKDRLSRHLFGSTLTCPWTIFFRVISESWSTRAGGVTDPTRTTVEWDHDDVNCNGSWHRMCTVFTTVLASLRGTSPCLTDSRSILYDPGLEQRTVESNS